MNQDREYYKHSRSRTRTLRKNFSVIQSSQSAFSNDTTNLYLSTVKNEIIIHALMIGKSSQSTIVYGTIARIITHNLIRSVEISGGNVIKIVGTETVWILFCQLECTELQEYFTVQYSSVNIVHAYLGLLTQGCEIELIFYCFISSAQAIYIDINVLNQLQRMNQIFYGHKWSQVDTSYTMRDWGIINFPIFRLIIHIQVYA